MYESTDAAGITSIEVLQSVIEEIQTIGIAQFHVVRNLHPKAIIGGFSEEDGLEEDLEFEIQNQLVMVNWYLSVGGCSGAWRGLVGGTFLGISWRI